ncbi:tRNA glutamyl-Q(34) synthetase GluQRS [Sinimarinibacterium thermocellulolyticum]|uniref:Glutamyl-Q tRNA(Asp) synthetase n=1 Tax=Sinimarinibacterium thermocellulolyticum TaxID=3170016 RepID=A0ABV2A8Q3_9GAMM
MIESPTHTGAAGNPKPRYRGRFAPTPSGPLHLGSLLTALASWLCARAANGSWLLRIDDLDRERCDPSASAQILRQLEAHGLLWDEAPRYQSAQLDVYAVALRALRDDGKLYACDCSRAQLRERARAGRDGPVYDGRCRGRRLDFETGAWRLKVAAGERRFEDGWQGSQGCRMPSEIGDFVVRRRDGIPAYQLACVVDEQAQDITEVVRGADLLASTFMQLEVCSALAQTAPRYRHLPVLVTADGRKLSKQTHAPAVDTAAAAHNLWLCLRWLGQAPPQELRRGAVDDVLTWARANWDAARVPSTACIKVEHAL